MMQGVKFRGKSLDGEWVYGFYVYSYDHDKHFIFGVDFEEPTEVDPHTVGQFAFMSNEHGYYHGDIVELDTIEIGGRVDVGFIVFNTDGTLDSLAYGLQCKYGYLATSFLGRLTLLGNIHDNTNLVKELGLPYVRPEDEY